jgi:hypothetical protein
MICRQYGETVHLGEMAAEASVVCRRFLKGLFQGPCPLEAPKFGPTLNFVPGSQFWILMTSPPSLLTSVSRNDLMEPDFYKDATILEDKMASPSSPSWTSTRGPFDPILNAQPWQSCAPVIRRVRRKRARRKRKTNRSRS